MSKDKVLDGVNPSKRSFIKGVVATTAFVVPTMVSFDMDSMSIHVGAHAYANQSNQSDPT